MIDTLIAWANAHAMTLALALAAANGLTRLIPESTMVRLERESPRLANLLRLVRAIGPDAVKGWRALVSTLLGRVWDDAKAIEAAAKSDAATHFDAAGKYAEIGAEAGKRAAKKDGAK